MIRPRVSQVLFLSVVLAAFGFATQPAFAGVHGGGGGGFHGGGGGWHGGGGWNGGGGWHGGGWNGGGWNGGGGWHGGGSWGGGGGWHGGGWHGGGWHGGYYGGWHGPYYGGWRGGYYGGWGYPGYWGGWGFGISFNFGWPYWGYYGYPYAYGYSPYYYPNYYPYPYYYGQVSVQSAYPDVQSGYPDPASPYNQPYNQPGANPKYGAPVRQPSTSVPQPPSSANGVKLFEATYRPAAASQRAAATSVASYRPPSSQRSLPAMRPAVQNVIRALNGMPPAARQREIDSGRYNTLTAQELELVRAVVSSQ